MLIKGTGEEEEAEHDNQILRGRLTEQQEILKGDDFRRRLKNRRKSITR